MPAPMQSQNWDGKVRPGPCSKHGSPPTDQKALLSTGSQLLEMANPTHLHPPCLRDPGKLGMKGNGRYFSWCSYQKQHAHVARYHCFFSLGSRVTLQALQTISKSVGRTLWKPFGAPQNGKKKVGEALMYTKQERRQRGWAQAALAEGQGAGPLPEGSHLSEHYAYRALTRYADVRPAALRGARGAPGHALAPVIF